MKNPHPEHDLRTTPYLDGVRMTATVWSRKRLLDIPTGNHSKESTGASMARLFEFGKRDLTDSNGCPKPDRLILKGLNTIKLVFDWCLKGKSQPRTPFHEPQEPGPLHEKAAKKGHSGVAKLGKTVTISTVPSPVKFIKFGELKPKSFVFCYAPENWLQARDIIQRSPEPEPQDTRGKIKRERRHTPEIVDVDELETDDDEIQIIKHMIPAPVSSQKNRRLSGPESTVKTKDEGD